MCSRRWSRASTTEDDGKQWELTLRDGLAFHDGTPVLAKDCVASIERFSKRDPFGGALMARVDEISAPSDKVIRFRLKKPFALLPNALAQVYCAIMPERLAMTDPFKQVTEAIGSGPFKFVAAERIPGQRVVYVKNDKYVPRKDGKPSFNAGPKIVYIDRVVWNFIPDAATASAALTQGEIDWWENPSIDLVPLLKRSKDLTLAVKDRTGEIGCLRFNHLFPPFDNAGGTPRRRSRRSTRKRSWRRSPAPIQAWSKPMSASSSPARRWRARLAWRSRAGRRTTTSSSRI